MTQFILLCCVLQSGDNLCGQNQSANTANTPLSTSKIRWERVAQFGRPGIHNGLLHNFFALSKTGAVVASHGSAPGRIIVWDIDADQEISLLDSSPPLDICAFSPDNKVLIAFTSKTPQYFLCAFEVETGTLLWKHTLSGQFSIDYRVEMAFSADGKQLMVCHPRQNNCYLLDPTKGTAKGRASMDCKEYLISVSWDETSQAFLVVTQRRVFRCRWEDGSATFEELLAIRDEYAQIVSISPTAGCVFVKYRDDQAEASVVNIVDKKLRWRRAFKRLNLKLATLNQTGTLAAVPDHDNQHLVLIDTKSGRKIGSFSGHGDMIQKVRFGVKDRILCCQTSSQIHLWDVQHKRRLPVCDGPEFVTCLTFSPDSKYLTFHDSSRVYIFHATTGWGRLIKENAREPKFTADSSAVWCVTGEDTLEKLDLESGRTDFTVSLAEHVKEHLATDYLWTDGSRIKTVRAAVNQPYYGFQILNEKYAVFDIRTLRTRIVLQDEDSSSAYHYLANFDFLSAGGFSKAAPFAMMKHLDDQTDTLLLRFIDVEKAAIDGEVKFPPLFVDGEAAFQPLVSAPTWSSDGKSIWIATNTIRPYRPNSRDVDSHYTNIFNIKISNGKVLLEMKHFERRLGPFSTLRSSAGNKRLSQLFTIHPTLPILALAGLRGKVHLWHLTKREWVGELLGHRGNVSSVCFSPDGRFLASGGLDGVVIVRKMSAVHRE